MNKIDLRFVVDMSKFNTTEIEQSRTLLKQIERERITDYIMAKNTDYPKVPAEYARILRPGDEVRPLSALRTPVPENYYVGIESPDISQIPPNTSAFWFNLTDGFVCRLEWMDLPKGLASVVHSWVRDDTVPRFVLDSRGRCSGAIIGNRQPLDESATVEQAFNPRAVPDEEKVSYEDMMRRLREGA